MWKTLTLSAALCLMPNRVIREGWVESEAVHCLSAEAERFFLRLCLKADDYGRYHGNEQLLKSHLFPLRETLRNTDIAAWIAECEKAGLVRCYEVTGKRYIHIAKFQQRLRIKREKFPPPPWPTDDRHMSDICPPEQVSEQVPEHVNEQVPESEKKPKPKTRTKLPALARDVEEELLGRTCLLVGTEIFAEHSGLFVTYMRECRTAFERALADAESRKKEAAAGLPESQINTNWGKYLSYTYKTFRDGKHYSRPRGSTQSDS